MRLRATASLLTLSLSATLVVDGFRTDIDKFLGTQSTKMVTEDVSAEDYTFQSDYSSTTELLDAIEDLGERMNEEGSVLLKNENARFHFLKKKHRKFRCLDSAVIIRYREEILEVLSVKIREQMQIQ